MNREILQEKYVIQRQLAAKGGRKTLLARNLTNEQLVIIKLLNFGNDLTWEDLKLFEREAKTLKSIAHESIPNYIDYFEIELGENKGFALVQEYINELSIEEQVQAGREFSEAEVKEIAIAILNILDYLHSRRLPIIHRDIKPSNILLGKRSSNSVGDIYLVDFGSVQNLATKKGGTITIVGTYGYMPPEQFGGRAKPASDLYSLGATLIYLITGQHPADLPENDLKIEFEQLVDISPGLANWLKKMTAPSLTKRYKSAKAALKELAECHLYNKQTFQYKKALKKAINQPHNSKVLLQKNSKNIRIAIAPAGLFSQVSYSNLAILAALSLFLRLLLPAFFLTNKYVPQETPEALLGDYIMWLLTLIVKSLSFITLAATILYLIKFFLGLVGSMQLSINNQRIAIFYKLFGIKRYSPLPSPRSDIYRLEKVSQSNNKSYLRLWTSKRTYHLAKNEYFPLTSLEVDWLGRELSNWLKLPLLEEYEIAQTIKPELAQAHQIKASAYFDLQEYQNVIKHCHQALKFNPESCESYYLLGMSQCKIKKDFSQGISNLKKAAEIAQKQNKPHFYEQIVSQLKKL